MTKPLWFLDVDGVLNAVVGRNGACPSTWGGDWSRDEIDGWHIVWSPSMVAAIIDLSSVADIMWLTTWRDRAVTSISPVLGLPEFPVADAYPVHIPWANWWKLPLARHVAGEDRTLIWTDDDLGGVSEAIAWLTERPGLALGVTPDARLGLTASELGRVAEFLEWTGDKT